MSGAREVDTQFPRSDRRHFVLEPGALFQELSDARLAGTAQMLARRALRCLRVTVLDGLQDLGALFRRFGQATGVLQAEPEEPSLRGAGGLDHVRQAAAACGLEECS